MVHSNRRCRAKTAGGSSKYGRNPLMPMIHSSRRNLRSRSKTNDDEGSSKTLTPNWLELPRDVTVAILQKLTPIEILQDVQMVCTQWHRICKEEPLLWRAIDMGGPMSWSVRFDNHAVICKQAADLSCGGLVDLSINCFGTDELLDYVTQRCNKIQRLRLICCGYDYITDEGLCNAANRLPLLEDLELTRFHSITEKCLQRFCECCPRLRSLKFNQQGSRYATYRDGEAMAIAKHMPELRHLQLFGNGMTNSGLFAILEGCPHLESLDLRQCFNIHVESLLSLRKICDERGIKEVRYPNDSTDDYEYDDTLIEVEYVRRSRELGYSDEYMENLIQYVSDDSSSINTSSDDDDDDTA